MSGTIISVNQIKSKVPCFRKRKTDLQSGVSDKPIKIISLYGSSYNFKLGENNIPIIDLFGYTYEGDTITVRVQGPVPYFHCKVPHGADPIIFKNYVKSRVPACVVDIEMLKDDRYFQFGKKVPFVKISSYDIYLLSKMKKYVIEAYETIRSGTKDSSIHRELEGFPLRYSNGLSPGGYIYFTMMDSGKSLINHLKINKYKVFDAATREQITKSKHMLFAKIEDIEEYVEKDSLLKHCIEAAYDIETDNLNPDSGKISDNRVDPIITIGVSFYKFLENVPFINIGFVYKDKPSDPIPGICLIECKSEREMLAGFYTVLDHIGFDVLTSFNGEKFDNKYYRVRCARYGLVEDVEYSLSRYQPTYLSKTGEALLMKWRANESMKADGFVQYGLGRFVSTQRTSFDVRLYYMSEYPKDFGERGNLNDMLQYFNIIDPETNEQMGKTGLTIKEMYRLWGENKPDGIATIIKYCVQDAKCVHMLCQKTGIFTDKFTLASASYTQFDDSLHRADGTRICKATATYAKKLGYAHMSELPHDEYWKDDDRTIFGGEVRSLRPGHHIFVVALDYSGQYPAQKMACNLSTQARIPFALLDHLDIVARKTIIDPYGPREIITIRVDDKDYTVEEFKSEGPGWIKPVYYVQSPKDEKGNVLEHFCIQEAMLNDFRLQRNDFKGQLKTAINILKKGEADGKPLTDDQRRHYAREIIRLGAEQLSKKILSNTEYGIGSNNVFALYDKDTAGAVTWCSRQLIRFLRKCLHASKIIIPEPIFEKIKSGLDKIGFTYEEIDEAIDFVSDEDGIILDKAALEHIWPNKKWYAIYAQPAIVIYQDTDSNYYTVPWIISKYADITDISIRATKTMHELLIHNDIFAEIIGGLINRPPIGLGFEGAFQIAYWMPQKKRYIGLVCPKDVSTVTTNRLDFTDYKVGMNIRTYLKKKNLKVTGMDIIRRDTYPYVIRQFFQFASILLTYNPPKSIESIIDKTLVNFIKILHDEDPYEFSKQSKYTPGKSNDVSAIVERLLEEDKQQLVPAKYDRVRYVVTSNDESYDLRGRNNPVPVRQRMRLLEEEITGAMLDREYYSRRLIAVLANFAVSEIYPEENDEVMMMEEGNERSAKIKELKEKATNRILSRYFAVPGYRKDQRKTYTAEREKAYGTNSGKDHVILNKLFNSLDKVAPNTTDAIKALVQREKNQLKKENKDIQSFIRGIESSMDSFDRLLPKYSEMAIIWEKKYIELSVNMMEKVRQIDEVVCRNIKTRREELVSDGMLSTISNYPEIPKDELQKLKAARDNFKLCYSRLKALEARV